ncbi:hypothetical protein BIW11_07407, partial [Tropilaelaps mercedesae]
QISNKGLKIVQNIARPGVRNNGKTDQVKHLIPGHAVTCVTQARPPHADVVCCILLVYNPVTRCPHHVHAYRCDSVETATSLRMQLEQLVDRPENRSRFEQVEARLGDRGDRSLHAGTGHLGAPISSREGTPRGHASLTAGLPLTGRTGSGSSHRLIGSDGRSTRTDDDDDPDLDNMDDIENKMAADHLDDLERSVCEEEALPNAVMARHSRPPDRNSNHRSHHGGQSHPNAVHRGRSHQHVPQIYQGFQAQHQPYPSLQGHDAHQSPQSRQSQHSQQGHPTDRRTGSVQPPEDEPESLLPRDPHVARLYDSLAQELKEKLAGTKANGAVNGGGGGAGAKGRKANQGPLLLPPKDYDTVCRRHGNLQGIDLRRSTNYAIVGQTLADGSPGQEDEELDYKESSDDANERCQRSAERQHASQSPQNGSGAQDGAGGGVIIASPRTPKTPNKATRLASNSSGKSSGIGSDEMLAGTDLTLAGIPSSGVPGSETRELHRRGTADPALAERDGREVSETPASDAVTSSDDEWNYRPAHRLHKEAADVRRGHAKQRPLITAQQHRSMDFLHHRLEHFHMGEISGHYSRAKASPEARRALHRSAHDLSPAGAMSLTFFGRQPPSNRRALSNHCLSPQKMSPNIDAPPSDLVGKQGTKGSNVLATKRPAPHEKPISFPMGVSPQRRDIPLVQPAPRYGPSPNEAILGRMRDGAVAKQRDNLFRDFATATAFHQGRLRDTIRRLLVPSLPMVLLEYVNSPGHRQQN